MVLFSESLTSLMQTGWEAHYLDYAGLKTIISQIKQASKQQAGEDGREPSALSEEFLAKATAQIVGVNAFVIQQKKEASNKFACKIYGTMY